MLQIKNLVVKAQTADERRLLFIDELNVASQEFVVIIGASGAGKSALLRTISGTLQADSGSILCNGHQIMGLSTYERSADIGVVVQDPRQGTMEHMTVYENMAFACMRTKSRGLNSFYNEERVAFFKEKLKLLGMGLEHKLDLFVTLLSGGQRQALSVLMALLAPSKLILLDEIVAALDPKTAQHVMSLTHTLIRHEKKSCLMVTHSMTHALTYADRIIIIENGAIKATLQKANFAHLDPVSLAAQLIVE